MIILKAPDGGENELFLIILLALGPIPQSGYGGYGYRDSAGSRGEWFRSCFRLLREAGVAEKEAAVQIVKRFRTWHTEQQVRLHMEQGHA